MKLSIIIVSWNVRELLEKCLASIEKNRGDLDVEVIVVDNASSDGSQEILKQVQNDHIKPILLDENLGFGKGNNEGLKHATGEYIFFLNDDTEIRGDALQVMVQYMDAHADIAAIGPKLLNNDGSIQRSVRTFPTLLAAMMIMKKVHNFIPRFPLLKNYFQLDFDYDKEQEVDQVMGAALLVRRSVLKTITPPNPPLYKGGNYNESSPIRVRGDEGGLTAFDPGYRRIFEEVDLCFRIKKAGHRIRYVPTAEIVHHKGASFTQQRIFQKQLDFNQGMLRFFKKHKPSWQYFVLYLFQPISWLATVFVMLVGLPFRKRFKKTDL